MKHTPEDHPDYTSLELAKRKIDEVTEQINEGKRYYEQLQKMMEIQNLVEGSTVRTILLCYIARYEKLTLNNERKLWVLLVDLSRRVH